MEGLLTSSLEILLYPFVSFANTVLAKTSSLQLTEGSLIQSSASGQSIAVAGADAGYAFAQATRTVEIQNAFALIDPIQPTESIVAPVEQVIGTLDIAEPVLIDTSQLVSNPVSSPSTNNRPIAFIASNVDDYQSLVAGLQLGTETYVLDPLSDAVSQITQALKERSNITSLYIFSHGSAGSLQLEETVLDWDDLSQYASEIQSWKQSLALGADILLYGCDVAAGDRGEAFVQQFSQWTGADVAASDNLTGSAILGGDWILEYSTGAIEATPILQASAQAAYSHVLATFTVTNANDGGAGSLRQAVLNANAAAGADVVVFGSLFTDQTPDTITLTSGQLQISGDLTIAGSGAGSLTISGNNASRVIEVLGSNVTIADVTIANGSSASGGGILNNGGSLALINSTLRNNSAQQGGGVFNAGNMLINGGSFTSNIASVFGGGVYNLFSMEVRNSTFNTNQAQQRDGGGLYNAGGANLTVDNDIFSRNTAGRFGGGFHNSGGALATVVNSVITDNTASLAGGGISSFGTIGLDNALIRGNQATGSGSAGGGVFNGGLANITNTSLLNDITAGLGGGIYNDTNATLTLRANSLVSGNRAADGGGIYNLGTASVGESSIISNRRQSFSRVGSDVWGNFVSEGFNTLYSAAGSTGFINGVNGDTVIF